MPEYIRFMGWWYQDLNQEKEGDGASEGAEREVGWNGEKRSLIVLWKQFLK